MTKKIFLSVLFVLGSLIYLKAESGYLTPSNFIGVISPTNSTNSVAPTSVAIASPGIMKKNCITDFSSYATVTSTVAIINGSLSTGTTMWQLGSVAANTAVSQNRFIDNAICGSENNAVTLNVIGAAGSYSINAQGYIRGYQP